MKLINLIEEDFTNYKKPGIFLGFPFCSGKCNLDAGKEVCQNKALFKAPMIDISAEEIVARYYNNPIPQCFIFGGLEPFDSFPDMIAVVEAIHNCDKFLPYRLKKTNTGGYASVYGSDIIIYTGYYPWEIEDKLYELSKHDTCENILIKFGRYLPGYEPHRDYNLGTDLASDNQFSLYLYQFVS